MTSSVVDHSAFAPWSVRPWRYKDIEKIRILEQETEAFPWTEKQLRDCLESGYSGWVLAWPHEGEGIPDEDAICGFAIFMMALDEAHLLKIAISRSCQRQGMGRYLLECAIKAMDEHGAVRVLLEVRTSNQPALALYARTGFEQIGCRKNYYPAAGGREDARVLERRITHAT